MFSHRLFSANLNSEGLLLLEIFAENTEIQRKQALNLHTSILGNFCCYKLYNVLDKKKPILPYFMSAKVHIWLCSWKVAFHPCFVPMIVSLKMYWTRIEKFPLESNFSLDWNYRFSLKRKVKSTDLLFRMRYHSCFDSLEKQ